MKKIELTNDELKRVTGGANYDNTCTCTLCWLNIPAGITITSYCDHSADGKHNFVPTYTIPEDLLEKYLHY